MGDVAPRWIKLAGIMMTGSLLCNLAVFSTPGWSHFSDDNCGGGTAKYCGSSVAVEFTEITGFLCNLAATGLILCILFLAEMKKNKAAVIAFTVLALLGGLLVVIGIGVFNGQYDSDSAYSTTLTVVCGVLALLAGLFGILELRGMKSPSQPPQQGNTENPYNIG